MLDDQIRFSEYAVRNKEEEMLVREILRSIDYLEAYRRDKKELKDIKEILKNAKVSKIIDLMPWEFRPIDVLIYGSGFIPEGIDISVIVSPETSDSPYSIIAPRNMVFAGIKYYKYLVERKNVPAEFEIAKYSIDDKMVQVYFLQEKMETRIPAEEYRNVILARIQEFRKELSELPSWEKVLVMSSFLFTTDVIKKIIRSHI